MNKNPVLSDRQGATWLAGKMLVVSIYFLIDAG